MNYDEYRAHPAVSQSDLKAYAADKLLYFQTRIAKTRDPKPPTESMQFGTRMEAAIRYGEPMDAGNYIKLPDNIKVRRGKAWEEFRASTPADVDILTAKEFAERDKETQMIRDALGWLGKHEHAQAILSQCEWHQRIFWECWSTGLERKAELDLVGPFIADVKTADDISPDGFAKSIVRFGYQIQAATYCQAFRSEFGGDVPRYFFIVVAHKQPNNCEVYELDQTDIDAGAEWNAKWMPRYQRSVENNDWEQPLTHNGPMLINGARWGKYQHEQLEEMMG